MARRSEPKSGPRRRIVAGGKRRTVSGPKKGADSGGTVIDDVPLAMAPASEGRWLLVSLPYDLWVLNTERLSFERSLALTVPSPSVDASNTGALWIGGPHLHRGDAFAGDASKVGTKLGGFVDRVVSLRADLLCGVGSHGELLWDPQSESDLHRRKTKERTVHGLVAVNGKAVFADGTSRAWIIDPAHPEGYGQVRFSASSKTEVPAEAIVCLGTTPTGGCILAARDGAVAWTKKSLRLENERHPDVPASDAIPLAVAADRRWVYVLRPRGRLHRFLVAQPEAPKKSADKHARPNKFGQLPEPEAPPELPLAQSARLSRAATALALVPGTDDASALIVGGPHADGLLGRVWRVDPETLEWEDLPMRDRAIVEEAPESDPPGKSAPPNFERVRHKPTGTKIGALEVDRLLGGDVKFLVTTGTGALVDRPTETMPANDILPADALLIPAMLRFHEGTARPGLLVWESLSDEQAKSRDVPPLKWMVWGDSPRGWTPLQTPDIRKQKWSRSEIFPMSIALIGLPEQVPGHRARVNARWADAEHFAAMAKECKKLLKVIW